jgi:hypothetical protein
VIQKLKTIFNPKRVTFGDQNLLSLLANYKAIDTNVDKQSNR